MKRVFSSKRDHVLVKVCVFLITVVFIAGMVGCGPTSQDLKIYDWYDLDDVRDNLAGNHVLMNDLDSTTAGYEELASPTANGSTGWEPIGSFAAQFTGTLNGQGYEIRDLFINYPGEDYVGLFGFVGEGGFIEDIGIVNVTVTAMMGSAGGLAGSNHGTVTTSYCTGSVTTGTGNTGGLAGLNGGIVSDSYFIGSLTGSSWVGGLTGLNSGTVSNSYSSSSVNGDRDFVGGLVGINQEGTVTNSYFTGSVTGDSSIGGLIGSDFNGIVSNSYYNYDEVLINGQNIITIGALFGDDFDEWIANSMVLDISARLSQEGGYYVISNVSDFKQLLAFGQNASLRFRLKNDLDLASEPDFYIPYLAGEFDGNGNRILNLSFNFGFVSSVGLFGSLAPGGIISQVGVENVNISGGSSVGALVGASWEGTVSDSYTSGCVTGEYGVGGLVGVGGTVSKSYSTSSVGGEGWVGGLVGVLGPGAVNNSYATGNVTGDERVGGLLGGTGGTVSNSYATGNVTANRYAGGLAGSIGSGTVINSYCTGSVTANNYAGGLAGSIGSGTVISSYCTGNVTATWPVGGLVGDNGGTVSDSFWDTETSGQAASDGGTGKTTIEMQNIATFTNTETEGLDEPWDMTTVADPSERNSAYIWNIVNDETYPFLSWQP